MGGVVPRNDHHAGRSAIQPVHDPGSHLSADAAEIRDVMKQGVHERAGAVPGAGVHNHARRLVEYREVRVLVEDFYRKRFSSDLRRSDLGHVDRDVIALTDR